MEELRDHPSQLAFEFCLGIGSSTGIQQPLVVRIGRLFPHRH
jgi:hypothetical protein